MLNQKLTGQQAAEKTYIEDVFSTYLYTGNGSTQTINNGIDLSGKGGLVWIKDRSVANDHNLFDTARGRKLIEIKVNAQAPLSPVGTDIASFDATGFTLGAAGYAASNQNTNKLVSWTFRKAPKFFDVVTYTGNGVNSPQRNIPHSLGVAPGCVIIKATSTTSNWGVWHCGSGGNTDVTGLSLNTTAAATQRPWMESASFNASTFAPFLVKDSSNAGFNTNGVTYVAYLFAHDTATDGLIQCGSYTGASKVTLGWEPQYILYKRSNTTGNWNVSDNMRGTTASGGTSTLWPNLSDAELSSSSGVISFDATGFTPTSAGASETYIYMAIRRGPMKTPTDGTKVFYAGTGNGSTTVPAHVTNFPVDAGMLALTRTTANSKGFVARLLGSQIGYMDSTGTYGAETDVAWDSSKGFIKGSWGGAGGYTQAFAWAFSRAPGFFDVVCYTGTGVARTVNHNLGVAPELMIVKSRSGAFNWYVYSKPLGATKTLLLNATDTPYTQTSSWNDTEPTNSVFTLGTNGNINASAGTYVAYLFASCPGVSKVGSYTGNGSSQTINCGFSAGARFVLIKRTDSTGDWYVWDTARGIVTGNDPHLSLNTTTAEVTSDDTIDPDASGFIVNQVAATNVNVSGGSYIYLAIA